MSDTPDASKCDSCGGESFHHTVDCYAVTVDDFIPAATERFFTASNDSDVVVFRDAIVQLGAQIMMRVDSPRDQALALTQLEDLQMRINRGLFQKGYGKR